MLAGRGVCTKSDCVRFRVSTAQAVALTGGVGPGVRQMNLESEPVSHLFHDPYTSLYNNSDLKFIKALYNELRKIVEVLHNEYRGRFKSRLSP